MRRTLFPRLLAGALVVLGGTAACSEDTSTVVRPLPNRAFNFLLNREGTNIPRGTVVLTRSATAATALTVTFQGLEVLRDPYFYQVWLATFNSTTNTVGSFVPVTSTRVITVTTDTSISEIGDFVPRVVTDTALNLPGRFNRGGPGALITLQANAAALAAIPTAATASKVLLVTIDSNPASPTPPDEFGTQARLWARSINTGTAATGTTSLSFGNFHANPAQQYVYSPTGRGRGALLENENILIVDDSALARPPRGYFYATALVTREDDDNFNNLDTIPLGAQTAPYPDRDVSLFNADVEQVHPVVQVALPNPQIFAAQARVDGDTIPGLPGAGNPFRGVALILITLENKFGTEATSPADRKSTRLNSSHL